MLSRDVAIVNGMVRTKDSTDSMFREYGIKRIKTIGSREAPDYVKNLLSKFEQAIEKATSPEEKAKKIKALEEFKSGPLYRTSAGDSKTKDENLKEKLIRLAEQAGDKEYTDDIRNGKVPLSQSELVRRIDWYTTRTVGQ